jgi:hypothetical protein
LCIYYKKYIYYKENLHSRYACVYIIKRENNAHHKESTTSVDFQDSSLFEPGMCLFFCMYAYRVYMQVRVGFLKLECFVILLHITLLLCLLKIALRKPICSYCVHFSGLLNKKCTIFSCICCWYTTSFISRSVLICYIAVWHHIHMWSVLHIICTVHFPD